jgi:YegS/Rv2252/BmrU family lipid kinase
VRGLELIVNPAAGRGRAGRLLPQVLARLHRAGFAGEPRLTRSPGEASVLVREALGRGAACVAIAGGDGTVNEAVNGYVGVARDAQALGVIPLGTGNDFAKMLGVGSDWSRACDAIGSGALRRVDAGVCNGRYFVNGVGAGFDAQVALEAQGIRWLRGNAVYGLALARTLLWHHSTPRARIAHDAGVHEGEVTLVAAANGAYYGGAFHMAPQADVGDGRLDVVVADALSRLGILGLVPHVLRGTHLGRPGVRLLRTRRLVIESEAPLAVHADGEILARAARRIDVEILAGALQVAA